MAKHTEGSVMETGAESGDILIGIIPINLGLIIEVFEFQPAKQTKAQRIKGEFIVPDAGHGKNCCAFLPFVGKTTTADEFISKGRECFATMTYPVSTDNLRLCRQDEIKSDDQRRT